MTEVELIKLFFGGCAAVLVIGGIVWKFAAMGTKVAVLASKQKDMEESLKTVEERYASNDTIREMEQRINTNIDNRFNELKRILDIKGK